MAVAAGDGSSSAVALSPAWPGRRNTDGLWASSGWCHGKAGRICKLGQAGGSGSGDIKHRHCLSSSDKNVLFQKHFSLYGLPQNTGCVPQRAHSPFGLLPEFQKCWKNRPVWPGDFPRLPFLKEGACSAVNSYGNCLLWMGSVRMGRGGPSDSGFLAKVESRCQRLPGYVKASSHLNEWGPKRACWGAQG